MRLATFSFDSYEDRGKAANEIYSNCNGYNAYEGGYYDGGNILHIKEGCNNVELAKNISMTNWG